MRRSFDIKTLALRYLALLHTDDIVMTSEMKKLQPLCAITTKPIWLKLMTVVDLLIHWIKGTLPIKKFKNSIVPVRRSFVLQTL